VFREVSKLGSELACLGDNLLGSRIEAHAAIWFDWESWWASENSMGPSKALNYVEEVAKYYAAFHGLGIAVDIIGPDTDLAKYKLLVAPVMYMLHPDTASRIEAFVRDGGLLLTTYLSGVADESDRVFRGGAPGPLKKLLGLWVEETDALEPVQKNKIVMKQNVGGLDGTFECSMLFDLVRLEGAETLASYGEDFYAGLPVLTRNRFGKGTAWYFASSADARFLSRLIEHLCAEQCIVSVMRNLPEGVEVTRRVGNDGNGYLFLLNHGTEKVSIDLGPMERRDLLSLRTMKGNCDLLPRDVLILEEKKK
jgi:beta-galactosidase